MTNTALLADRIKKSGYRKSYIAKRLGLTAYGFARKVRGDSEFKAAEIATLCELLGIDDLAEKEAIFFA